VHADDLSLEDVSLCTWQVFDWQGVLRFAFVNFGADRTSELASRMAAARTLQSLLLTSEREGRNDDASNTLVKLCAAHGGVFGS
jgi:hypothetical protein